MLPTDAGQILLPIARLEIERALGGEVLGAVPSLMTLPGWVQLERACFVTLTQMGELRGCIGTIIPYQPLLQDVKKNAVQAATRDPRFSPLKKSELADIKLELSVLSPIEAMTFKDEADALSQLQIGIDGLVLEWHGYRSTFLPQVWENVRNEREFLSLLKRKAGLPLNFWADDLTLSRYSVIKWTEEF